MIFRLKQMSLLFWHYLNQPLFDRSDQTSFGIQRFLHLYRIQTLERCWQKKCHRQRQFYH